MLVDQFNRRFSYLRLSVTEVCNFRCDYCLPEGHQQTTHRPPEMTLSEIKTLVAAFARSGTRKIRLTGGEPTLRKDLPEIIRICRATPGIREVTMTSNGYRLDKQLPALRAAGLDSLNLSVDSLDRRTFHNITGHDHLPRILNAVAVARELSIPVKFNAVLMRQDSRKELARFTDYVRDHDVTVRFIELMETGDNTAFFRQQHIPAAAIEEKLAENGWQLMSSSSDAGPAREYSHPGFSGRIGLIRPYRQGFCDDCNRLRVSSRGDLQLCLFADGRLPLRPWLNEQTPEQLSRRLHELVLDKRASHQLHQRDSGITSHLAMIGG